MYQQEPQSVLWCETPYRLNGTVTLNLLNHPKTTILIARYVPVPTRTQSFLPGSPLMITLCFSDRYCIHLLNNMTGNFFPLLSFIVNDCGRNWLNLAVDSSDTCSINNGVITHQWAKNLEQTHSKFFNLIVDIQGVKLYRTLKGCSSACAQISKVYGATCRICTNDG